eukprot:2282541-Rhodomonas_salina.1
MRSVSLGGGAAVTQEKRIGNRRRAQRRLHRQQRRLTIFLAGVIVRDRQFRRRGHPHRGISSKC